MSLDENMSEKVVKESSELASPAIKDLNLESATATISPDSDKIPKEMLTSAASDIASHQKNLPHALDIFRSSSPL